MIGSFPRSWDDAPDGDEDQAAQPLDEMIWQPVPADRDGYIQDVDDEALLRLAQDKKAVVRMEHGIGEFVVQGTALASLGLDDAYRIKRRLPP